MATAPKIFGLLALFCLTVWADTPDEPVVDHAPNPHPACQFGLKTLGAAVLGSAIATRLGIEVVNNLEDAKRTQTRALFEFSNQAELDAYLGRGPLERDRNLLKIIRTYLKDPQVSELERSYAVRTTLPQAGSETQKKMIDLCESHPEALCSISWKDVLSETETDSPEKGIELRKRLATLSTTLSRRVPEDSQELWKQLDSLIRIPLELWSLEAVSNFRALRPTIEKLSGSQAFNTLNEAVYLTSAALESGSDWGIVRAQIHFINEKTLAEGYRPSPWSLTQILSSADEKLGRVPFRNEAVSAAFASEYESVQPWQKNEALQHWLRFEESTGAPFSKGLIAGLLEPAQAHLFSRVHTKIPAATKEEQVAWIDQARRALQLGERLSLELTISNVLGDPRIDWTSHEAQALVREAAQKLLLEKADPTFHSDVSTLSQIVGELLLPSEKALQEKLHGLSDPAKNPRPPRPNLFRFSRPTR